MRSNTKIVMEQVKTHILEYFTIEELKTQVKAMTYMGNAYTIGAALVAGGSFLIYNKEINDFLNGLGINPEGKEYDDQKSFDQYKHMVARQVEKLVESK